MGVGAGGEVFGVALDATGVGAIAGVPINIASAAMIAGSAGLAYEGLKGELGDVTTMYSEAQEAAAEDAPTYPSGSNVGPGEWKPLNRPDRPAYEYQRQVSKTPLGPNGETYEYEVNGVSFDGYDSGPSPTLLDSEDNYAGILKAKFGGDVLAGLRQEAIRQVQAANGQAITWVCSQPETAAQLEQLIDDNGLGDAIKVVVELKK